MREPKTKAEAQQAIQDMTARAERCDQLASWQRKPHKREHEENAARFYRSEADRLSALLPSLPEAP